MPMYRTTLLKQSSLKTASNMFGRKQRPSQETQAMEIPAAPLDERRQQRVEDFRGANLLICHYLETFSNDRRALNQDYTLLMLNQQADDIIDGHYDAVLGIAQPETTNK